MFPLDCVCSPRTDQDQEATISDFRPLDHDDPLEGLTLVGANQHKARADIAGDVRKGLSDNPKWLPCLYFYDEAGSQLFEKICELPEYYPTRTERAILEKNADDLVAHVDHHVDLVELGSGSATKTRLVVEALLRRHGQLRFIPIDISRSILEESSRALVEDYDDLEVFAVAGEYHDGLDYLKERGGPPRMILWLGSNVGNFSRPDAVHFLRRLHDSMRDVDRLLIGIDLRKDPAALVAAYDDAEQITAAFNKNLLTRINRDLGGHFDLDAFTHEARWNEENGRVEMHLVSQRVQTVRIDGIDMAVDLAMSESIHTENSYKYSQAEIEALAAAANFDVECQWFDAQDLFSVNLWRPIS